MKNILPFCVILFLFSCDKDEDLIPDNVIVSYGYAFGECLGYCMTETYLTERKVTVVKRANVKDREPVKSTAPLSIDEINEILDAIDYQQFKQLPQRVGCPDCNDGGAEWLELIIDGEKKKVTFEYRKDVEGIAAAVQLLRQLTEEMKPYIDYD